MAWISKISYLDGVSFAINPLFVPSDQDDEDIEELFYDLDKAKSILSSKHEFLTENKILEEDKEDFDYSTDMAQGSSSDLKRPKSSSFTQAAEKNQESILKLLNEFKSPLAFQSSLTSANDPPSEVKFSLESHSPNPSPTTLSSSLPPASQLSPNIYPNAKMASIAFNANTLKNNRSTENFEKISKSPRIENETLNGPSHATTPHAPMPSNSIKKIPTYSNSILEPIRPLASNAQASSHDELLLRKRTENKDSSRTRVDGDEKNGVSLDIFEAPSADPFNDMELKSINDIEELKNILSQHQMQQKPLNESGLPNGNKDALAVDQAKRSGDSTTTNNTTIQAAMNSTTTTVASLPCAVDNYGLPNIKFNDMDF